MPATNNPLKRLVAEHPVDFATWLLGEGVQAAELGIMELPTDPQAIAPDEVLVVTLMDGRQLVLHIEFQGPGSKSPMPRRMRTYIDRIAGYYPDLPVYSVVIYVGHGTGRHDTGVHVIPSHNGPPTMTWAYRVIRLWELPAEDLLELERPTLIPLIGLMQITTPERLLPEAVGQIKTLPDRETQRRLFTELVLLCSDKELELGSLLLRKCVQR